LKAFVIDVDIVFVFVSVIEKLSSLRVSNDTLNGSCVGFDGITFELYSKYLALFSYFFVTSILLFNIY
jgi:hypothetical protein